jgi:hypothetical protein
VQPFLPHVLVACARQQSRGAFRARAVEADRPRIRLFDPAMDVRMTAKSRDVAPSCPGMNRSGNIGLKEIERLIQKLKSTRQEAKITALAI